MKMHMYIFTLLNGKACVLFTLRLHE